MTSAVMRTHHLVHDLFAAKEDLLSLCGLGFFFAAYFRSLIGATTFQSFIEIAFHIATCIVLFIGLLLVCIVSKSNTQSLVTPVGMSAGALLDLLFGSIFGRASTPAITLVFLIAGSVCIIVLYVKHCDRADDSWRTCRAKASYEKLGYPLCYLAVFLVILGTIFGCLFILHVGGLNKGVSQLGFFVGCVLSAIIIIPLLIATVRRVEMLAKATLLFLIAGFSFIMLFKPTFVSLMVLAIGFCCFLHLAFRMVFDYYRTFSLPLLFPIAYLFVLFFSIVAGFFLGSLLILSTSALDLDAFTLVSILVLNVISVLGLGSNHSWNVNDLLTEPKHAEREEQGSSQTPLHYESLWRTAIAEIAAEADLSSREQEVFTLMAKGRNASYIERELYISNHTARAHVLNVYKKLDLHSQQAVLDYVEERVAQKKAERIGSAASLMKH